MSLTVHGNMKVMTLKKQFKDNFELTLRVYDGRSFADDDATLSSIRRGAGEPGEYSPQKNTKVGNFEDKMSELFGIKVQIAGSDDSYLCEDGLTLKAAKEKDDKKIAKKLKKEGSANMEETMTKFDALDEAVRNFNEEVMDDNLSDAIAQKLYKDSEFMTAFEIADLSIEDMLVSFKACEDEKGYLGIELEFEVLLDSGSIDVFDEDLKEMLEDIASDYFTDLIEDDFFADTFKKEIERLNDVFRETTGFKDSDNFYNDLDLTKLTQADD